MRTHVAFETASSQQGKILDWLVEDALRLPQDDVAFASVGAGSGILDVPLLDRLHRNKTVRYTVVEPVAAQCDRFRERAQRALGSDGPAISYNTKNLCDVEQDVTFDTVLSIHSIYYMDDLDGALDSLLAMRRHGSGRLVIAVAPKCAMNRLAEVFWEGQVADQVWFAPDVAGRVEERGLEFTATTIHGQLTIPAACAPVQNDILSFLIQTRFDRLPQSTRKTVSSYLEEVGERVGDRLIVPHPVDVLTVGGVGA